mgnify:CR=1 FL=1
MRLISGKDVSCFAYFFDSIILAWVDFPVNRRTVPDNDIGMPEQRQQREIAFDGDCAWNGVSV